MNFLEHWLLTILLLIPAVGGTIILLLRSAIAVRRTSLGVAVATLCISLLAGAMVHRQSGRYDYAPSGLVQMVCEVEILPAIRCNYRVAADGLSIPFAVITSLIGVLACIASWNGKNRSAAYFAMLLWLESATLGVVVSFDLLLLWTFLAFSILPSCALIYLDGPKHRARLLIIFLSYMLVGLACLFVATLGVRLMSTQCFAGGSLDLVGLASKPIAQAPLFLLMLIGFLVRLAAFPLHSWFASVTRESSVTLTMLLGLIPLTGGYGLLRVAMPLFPGTSAGPWWVCSGIGAMMILYCGLCAIGLTEARSAAAQVCLAMSGFALMGIATLTPAGVNGAMIIVLSQSLIAPCLIVFSPTSRNPIDGHLGARVLGEPLVFVWLAELVVPGFLGQIMVLLGFFQWGFRSPGLALHHATIGLMLLVGCLGVALIGLAGVRILRRPEPGLSGLPDGRETTAPLPIAMAAVLLAVLVAPFCFAYASSALAAMISGGR